MAKYSKQISLGYDQNGKRVRKWIHADSQQELKRKERELLKRADQALVAPKLFGEYAQAWLKTYKSNKETRTREFYETGVAKLSALNKKELSRITRSMLQEILAENWEHPRTCKKLANIMSQIFRSAIADGLIWKNPAESLDIPKQTKTEKRILTQAEKEAIASAELPASEKLFLDLCRHLGLRPEEARALTRSDIDFKDKTISINKAVIFAGNAPELKGVKNGKPRTIPLQNDLVPALKSYIKDCGWLLFTDSKGNLMSKSSFRCFQKRIFDEVNRKLGGNGKMNVLNGMTFYTLRHTRGTELYYLTQQGKISTKLAAQYMGHSEIVFLSTYSHIDEEKEQLEALRAVTNL